ncbi:MAG: hypothetical protein J5852_05975 [Clostridia bacterium]|nr:hypothetical protein [Clostridia bacterium]
MSQTEINTAINNAEASLVIEGLSVSKQTKALCKKLLAKEITMSEYIAIIKQNAMVSQNGI